MERKEVYRNIDIEREYQDSRWDLRDKFKSATDNDKSIAEWILYMEHHLNKAKQNIYSLNSTEALGEIRKVTALGVRTMEVHGCPERII
jgi:hypothetical protein